jgi:hypothetical protein
MLTQANVRIIDNTKAELTQNGKKLMLVVKEPASGTLKTRNADYNYATNKMPFSCNVIEFDTQLTDNRTKAISVLLIPEGNNNTQDKPKAPSLQNWPK